MAYNRRVIFQLPHHVDPPPGPLPDIVTSFPVPVVVQTPPPPISLSPLPSTPPPSTTLPPPNQADDLHLQSQLRAVQVQLHAVQAQLRAVQVELQALTIVATQGSYRPDDEGDGMMVDHVDDYWLEDETQQT